MPHETERPHNIEACLHEATRILKKEFGDIDQQAAVNLATFLFTSWERVEFIERETETPAYGRP